MTDKNIVARAMHAQNKGLRNFTFAPNVIVSDESDRDKDSWEIYRSAIQSPLFNQSQFTIGSSGISVDREAILGRNITSVDLLDVLNIRDFPTIYDVFSASNLGEVSAQGEAIVARRYAEIDRLSAGREASYAKLALARSQYVTDAQPQIHKAPEGGIVLRSSTEKGTLNIIFEEQNAILIRTTDDFTVQVTCDLNPVSISELLEMYESELTRI